MARTTNAQKTATNLSVRADLVREARVYGVNLSEVLEQGLTEVLRERRRDAWLKQNERAIDRYNARVAKQGVFSDGWRRF
jgi:antitoxin CcdA